MEDMEENNIKELQNHGGIHEPHDTLTGPYPT